MNGSIHKMRNTFWLLIFLCQFNLTFGQNFSTQSRRAIKHFEEGTRNYNLKYLDKAKVSLKKAIKADVDFLEAYMLLADVLKLMDDAHEAQIVYQQVIQLNTGKYPEVYYFSGLLYFELSEYSKAIAQLQEFLHKDDGQTKYVQDAIFYLDCSAFAIEAIKNPVQFEPKNIGNSVNSVNDEFINAVRIDGLKLFFTGRQNNTGYKPGGDDFYFSTRTSETYPWQPSRKLGPPVNTPGNEGALTISPDGRYLLFAGCEWPQGYGSCDIYVSKLLDGKAEKPFNIGSVINSSAWESQPSLSSDGRTLYFSSTRSGGFGQSDIWKSYLREDGGWTAPENLGAIINTKGSEMSPFIHPDGQTLYFSSNRHVGIGGIDLFLSRLDSTGIWTEPVNLGYPLNTPGDEINIFVDVAGNKGYISADKLGGFGGYDIFEFEMPQQIRPMPVTFLKGVVVDAISKKPIESLFSLINLKTNNEIVRAFSDKATGEFLVCVPVNSEYALNVSKENYLFFSENIFLKGVKNNTNPHLINIALNPIVEGSTVVLRNIFFESGKFDLLKESLVELEKLVQFLTLNPGVSIEISGHTDNVGSEDYNIELSANRAKAVYEYLITKNIAPDRLKYKGYGFSVPISVNDTQQGRAQNRRTEIKIN